MINKEVLNQYADLQMEVVEIRKKINYLEDKIPKLEKRLSDIEKGETVKDKVYGGEGGRQSFVIEGVPLKEYHKKKTALELEKVILEERKELLKTLELRSMWQINEIEEFMKSIEDCHIRMIVRLRVMEGLSWNEVADKIGGGNTEDSVRMAYNRFVK